MLSLHPSESIFTFWALLNLPEGEYFIDTNGIKRKFLAETDSKEDLLCRLMLQQRGKWLIENSRNAFRVPVSLIIFRQDP